jgi:hypothetical protein
MDILGLIEDWQQTGQIPPEDMRLFELAAIAAPLCRQERIRREIDKE